RLRWNASSSSASATPPRRRWSPHRMLPVPPAVSSLTLRRPVLVALVGDLEQQEHRVVLVDRVVAVHGPAAPEVTEAKEQLDLLVEPEPGDVLAAEFDVAAPDEPVVAPHHLEFFEVNVDGMLPAAGVVLDDPAFGGVALDREAEARAVGELLIDRPLAVAALEPERARDPDAVFLGGGIVGRPRRCADRRERALLAGRAAVGIHLGGRQARVGRRGVAGDPELHEEVAVARGKDLVRRRPAVDLLQAVLEADGPGAGGPEDLVEVDDDVGT